MISIKMPALAPGVETAELTCWLVHPGDTIAAGMCVAEVEVEKATVEIEAACGGVVEELLVPEGAEVKAGSSLLLMRAM